MGATAQSGRGRGGAADWSRIADDRLIAAILGGREAGRARALLERLGGLDGLVRAGSAAARGLAPAASRRLAAALELARRVGGGGVRPALLSPEAVGLVVRDIAAARREHLVGLYVDTQGGLIERETLAVGSLNVAHATPRDALEPALRLAAAALILAHNHPSGRGEPSEEDVRFTGAVARGARLLGLALHDHVIVTRAGVTSLRACGLLDRLG